MREVKVNVKHPHVRLGSELELDCDASIEGQKTIRWQKLGNNENPDKMADNVQVNLNRLIIRELRIENGGVYRCIVSSEAKTVHADHLVVVQGA